MANNVKCPKSPRGHQVGRIKVNAKKMRVGQCLKCGRLVNLGKAEETNTPEETNKQTAAGEPGKDGKHSPAPARRSAGRAAGQQQRSVPARADVPKRSGWAAVRDFFDL